MRDAPKEITEGREGILRSFDEKMDAATHAAFNELGLSVAANFEAACNLNDYLTQAMSETGLVSGDQDNE